LELDELIQQGRDLKTVHYESPRYEVWQNDVRAAVTPYGEKMLEVLESTFFFGQVIMSDQHGTQMKNEAIDKTIEFLETLKARNPQDSRAQAALISQKQEEARHTLRAKLGNATFNGPVTFGDNSPISQVQVGEFIAALVKEAEQKLPDGEDKSKIVSQLKSMLANPTFAAIAGVTVPEVLKKLFGS
jgi:hypothetical protein